MTQDKPPRSLRKGNNAPRYYRNWEDSAAPSSPSEDEMGEQGILEPQEMAMVDEIEVEEAQPAPAPTPMVMQAPRGEMAELNVIVPDLPLEPEPEKSKPTITRVDRPKIQRARRRSEIEKDEAANTERERKTRELEANALKPKTTATVNRREIKNTVEIKSNMEGISSKIDETKENVKHTAEHITENIKNVSDKITDSVVSGVQKVGGGLVSMINRWGRKPEPKPVEYFEDDFEDDPIPEQRTSDPIVAESPEPEITDKKDTSLLDLITDIPSLNYGTFYQQEIQFLAFDKTLLLGENPDPENIHTLFIENAIADLHKCVKVVKKLPDPKDGPYAGIPVAYVFKHVRETDLHFFLHYVQQKPKTFVGKNLKLSEAFASWLIKRSHKTIIGEPFPEIPEISYVPLFKKNIRFLTVNKRQLVLTTGKSPEEIDDLFLENAIADVKQCIDLVRQFPKPTQGPYKGRALALVFKRCRKEDIWFFLHYINQQPDVFQGKNFKFAEAFASWILQRSHETKLSLD